MNLFRRRVSPTGPVRVLFVVPDLRFGGAERHVSTLAPALDRRQVVPSVVCIGEEGGLFPGLAATGVPTRALRLHRRPVKALLTLMRIMRAERPDVVVTRGYSAEGLGRVAAMLTRVPRCVIWVHNCGDVEPRGRVRSAVDRVLAPVTDAYYAVAHGQRSYLTGELGYPDERIQVIYNGVDPATIPLAPGREDPAAAAVAATFGIGPEAPVIGVIAVLRPEKDHANLLQAMRLVLDEIPEARLLVIGDGEERARLEALAGRLDIAGSVVFTGSRDDVPTLLSIVDVVALSSYTVECFPMALLEAMAAGVPTVATSVGGVPEMVEDGVTGYVVEPHDPRSMAAALVKILHDRDGASAMGAAARRRVEEQFTLDRSVRAAEEALVRTARRLRPVRLSVVMDLTFVGGAEILLLELLRRWDRADIEPEVVCLREEGPLAADFRAAGVPVTVLDRSGRFDLSTLPRLVRHLRRRRTDVVLVNHHHRAALTLGRLAALLARVRANVVAAHDMDLAAVGGRVLPRHDVETLFLADALVLLAPSQGRYLHDKEQVGSRPWRRTREVVIGNGIEVGPAPGPRERIEARQAMGVSEDATVLGIVARLSPQKAHSVLLRALARLAPDRPDLILVVVGDGEERAAIEKLAGELGIADRVVLTGLRRDVRALLPGFDIACLSSVHEGVPLTVLESMAAGVPVVATDVGALRDLVTDGKDGYLVPSGDDASLAERLAVLIDDPAQRVAFGAAARARAVDAFPIEHTLRGYRTLLRELLS